MQTARTNCVDCPCDEFEEKRAAAAAVDVARACEQLGCPEIATVRYHWPSRGFMRACTPHGRKAQASLRAMGMASELEPLEPGAEAYVLEALEELGTAKWAKCNAIDCARLTATARAHAEVFEHAVASLLIDRLPRRPAEAPPAARFFIAPAMPGIFATEITDLVRP